MKVLITALVVAAAALAAGAVGVYAGLYNVAADEPHWGITERIMSATRDRSVAARARGVGAPPALDDPELLAMGAEHYAEMCTGCHLAPGLQDSEMSAGLYPRPPKLAEHTSRRSSEETFWIIKHGVKMSGMPAWGVTHDDQSIWGMVALVRKLPELSVAEYEALVGRGRSAGHGHGGENDAPADAAAAMGSHPHDDERKPHEHSHDEAPPHEH
jgi:mono/diheme cytochrome c family protein